VQHQSRFVWRTCVQETQTCQDKRRQYIQLLQKDTKKFLQLCAEFDALAATTKTELQKEEEIVASLDTNLAYRDQTSYSSDSLDSSSKRTESDTDESEESSVVSQKKKKAAKIMSHRKVQRMIGFGKKKK
jgi:hypothetical protein